MKSLFNWQTSLVADIVDGPNKYGVLEKSRRVGGTWVFAIAVVEYALKTGHDVWFSSTDEDSGKEFILYVTRYCELYNAILGTDWVDLKDATTERVYLPTGSRVTALSSNPDNMRGKDGLIVLDEFAHHDDGTAMYTAAQGCVMQKGKLWLLSTHNGPATVFFQLATEAARGKPNWSHHKVTLEDAVRQGYALKFATHHHHLGDAELINRAFIEEVRQSCISEDAYGQEYMCLPLSLSTLITEAEYDRLVLKDAVIPVCLDLQREYGELFVGVDVGRTRDLTVVWVLERGEDKDAPEQLRDVYRTVCVLAMHNTTFAAQFQRIDAVLSHPSVTRCHIDEGAIGKQLAEELQHKHGGIVRPVAMGGPFKARTAEQVKKYVTQERVSLPGEWSVKQDVLSLRRAATPKGNLSYEGSTGFSHCDHFWSLALALDAATTLPTFDN